MMSINDSTMTLLVPALPLIEGEDAQEVTADGS
jgi:hypothetical protein